MTKQTRKIKSQQDILNFSKRFLEPSGIKVFLLLSTDEDQFVLKLEDGSSLVVKNGEDLVFDEESRELSVPPCVFFDEIDEEILRDFLSKEEPDAAAVGHLLGKLFSEIVREVKVLSMNHWVSGEKRDEVLFVSKDGCEPFKKVVSSLIVIEAARDLFENDDPSLAEEIFRDAP